MLPAIPYKIETPISIIKDDIRLYAYNLKFRVPDRGGESLRDINRIRLKSINAADTKSISKLTDEASSMQPSVNAETKTYRSTSKDCSVSVFVVINTIIRAEKEIAMFANVDSGSRTDMVPKILMGIEKI